MSLFTISFSSTRPHFTKSSIPFSTSKANYLTIRGPIIGESVGIDSSCTDDRYLHNNEITNRYDHAGVKTPFKSVLIENSYCNHSGGLSIGLLTADITSSAEAAAVFNIAMQNIYSYKSTQMLMIEPWPGGSDANGYVKDSFFEGFWSYDCTYGLDIHQCTLSTPSQTRSPAFLTG